MISSSDGFVASIKLRVLLAISSISAILINGGNVARRSLVRSSSPTKMAVPQEGVRRRIEDSGEDDDNPASSLVLSRGMQGLIDTSASWRSLLG